MSLQQILNETLIASSCIATGCKCTGSPPALFWMALKPRTAARPKRTCRKLEGNLFCFNVSPLPGALHGCHLHIQQVLLIAQLLVWPKLSPSFCQLIARFFVLMGAQIRRAGGGPICKLSQLVCQQGGVCLCVALNEPGTRHRCNSGALAGFGAVPNVQDAQVGIRGLVCLFCERIENIVARSLLFPLYSFCFTYTIALLFSLFFFSMNISSLSNCIFPPIHIPLCPYPPLLPQPHSSDLFHPRWELSTACGERMLHIWNSDGPERP